LPRSVANKNYQNFVAGMITEASALTYPENATTIEDNCALHREGNRTRRLGFEAEQDVRDSLYTFKKDNNLYINDFSWEAVDETGQKDFYVIRIGNLLYFYDSNVDPIDQGLVSFSIDLRPYKSSTSSVSIETSNVAFSSGRGFLFVVGEQIDPLMIEYNPDNGDLAVHRINIRIRDFVGLDDGLDNDFEPTVLSTEHHYNLRNQGWVAPSSKTSNTTGTAENGDVAYITLGSIRVGGPFFTNTQGINFSSDPITKYKNQVGLYPANNKAWWVGKLETDNPDKGLVAGDFDPDILCGTYVGNTLAARGHYILDAFNRDRSNASGVTGIEAEVKTSRPSSVGFYAGRVWYGHESDVYYSQTLRDHRQAGNCYQEADPTSEDISDLIATDGGLIPIPEAFNIRRMHPIGGSMLVFAENGVWAISGGGGNGFSATDISVSKVSSNGILGPETLVEAGGVIYWWAPSGIMSLAQRAGMFGTQEGVFDRENITETTIQSFYNNNIPHSTKLRAKGYYDPSRNLIQWLFKSNGSFTPQKALFNRILNFDATLKAFYPWTISDITGDGITGALIRPTIKQIQTQALENVQGTGVINSYFLYHYATPFSNSLKLSFGDFTSSRHLDYGETSYTSFMETGFEVLEDLMRSKQSNYVFLYFRRTDTGKVSGASLGDFFPDSVLSTKGRGIPSSCYFQTKWDWSRNENSGRWSRKIQGYRKTSRFDDSHVVSTKHKARGHGRALQVRFESSEPDTTFDLLGWATNYSGNTTV